MAGLQNIHEFLSLHSNCVKFIEILGSAARLREERERVGLTQVECAERGAVGTRSQIRYEHGESSPQLDYLANMQAAGLDVHYVLSGVRQSDGADSDVWLRAGRIVDKLAVRHGVKLDPDYRRRLIARLLTEVGGPQGKQMQVAVQKELQEIGPR